MMKIYIKNLYLNNYKNLNKLDDKLDNKLLLTKTFTYKDVYSTEGLFRIKKNVLYKLIPIDRALENYESNYIIDKSELLYNTSYYIPYEHFLYNYKQIEYKLDKNELVSLVILYENNKLYNIYFTIDNKKYDKMNKIIQNEIDTFLSILNNIK